MNRKLTTPDRVMLLMSLVPYLNETGPTPVAELAQNFSVEPEVLRQLVRFLGVAGIPGETQTYQHEDLFDIDWEALEQYDIVSLTRTVAVDDTPRFSSLETAALTTGLHALGPMLPAELRETALRTSEKLALVQPVGGEQRSVSLSVDPVQPHLTAITSAITQAMQLTFEYRDASATLTRRTVEPLLLSQSGGAWYLRGYCLDRQAERTFMVDRIREVSVLHLAATHRLPARSVNVPDPAADPADLTAAVLELEAEPEPELELEPELALEPEASLVPSTTEMQLTTRLRLTKTAMHRIADFAPKLLAESMPGWVFAEVDLLHAEVAVRLVQAAPGEIIVEGPSEARAAVRDWVERALAKSDL